MHLSLKKINYLIISLVAFCILSISCLSIYQNSSIFSKLNSFYEHPFTVINSVTNVRKNSRTLWDYTNEAIFFKKNISKAQIENLEKEIELNLAIVNKQYLGPRSDCEDLEKTYKFHKELIGNIFLLIEKNEIEEAKRLLSDDISNSNYRQLIDDAERIIKHAQNKAINFIDEANNQLIDFRNTLIVVSIVVSLFGIIASIFTLRFIRKRFFYLKTSLNSINHDNLNTVEIKENDIQDFIDIQSSINLMTKRLDNSKKEILALKQKYQVLFDNSPDAYFIMEINAGEILDCNDTALKMLKGDRLQKTLILEHRFQKHLNGVYSFT